MSLPANTPMAHATQQPPYHSQPADPSAPRSSSLPFPYLMGLTQSKPTTSPTTSNVHLSSNHQPKAFSAAVAGGIKLKRAFAARRKKSDGPHSAISAQVAPPPLSPLQTLSPSPPPTPPSKDTTNPNRHSVIPLSPGISSAVNYIAMYDHSSPSSPSPEKETPTTQVPPPQANTDSQKESWRKSDSTNSHHTVRPRPSSTARASRPVSWAESFQSAYTVVQQPNGGSGGGAARPLSALIADADFGMPEADDEESDTNHAAAVKETNRPEPPPPIQAQFPTAPAPPSSFTTAPTSTNKAAHRRSISLDLPIPHPILAPHHPPASTPHAQGYTHTSNRLPSHSISEGVGVGVSAVALHNARIYPALPGSVSGSGSGKGAGESAQVRRTQQALHSLRPAQQQQQQQQQHTSHSSTSSSASSASSFSSTGFASTSSLSSPGIAPVPAPAPHAQQPRSPTTPQASASASVSSHPHPHPPPSSFPSHAQPHAQPHPHLQPHPHPNQPTHQRTQTTSMSSTLTGPAAAVASLGRAKRAVEGLGLKMGLGMARKWALGAVSPGGAGAVGDGYEHERERERERGGERDGYSSSSTSASASSSAAPSAFGFGKSKSASQAQAHSHAHPHALVRTSSGSSAGHAQGQGHAYSKSHGHLASAHAQGQGQGHRNASSISGSSASSHSHSHSHSQSQHDTAHQQLIAPPEGPVLGRLLRGPLVGGGGGRKIGGGLVFKRDLAKCVRETGVWVGSASASGGGRGSGRVDGSEAKSVAKPTSKPKDAKNKDQQEDEDAQRRRRVRFARALASSQSSNTSGNANGNSGNGNGKERQAQAQEQWRWQLPALVVRCAQHLLLWGVYEEGLFRVSGMPQHVAKLRAEFDAGCDYDMTECTPGDLDPHAVASVFKAYLRELPEPILTHKLQPLFDAAVNKETSLNSSSAAAASAAASAHPTPMRMSVLPGRGLPANPKSGFTTPSHKPTSPTSSSTLTPSLPLAHTLRKPPSLSTLSAPTFTGIPPASAGLIRALRTLVALLPRENRDLLRAVVRLIRATAERSRETKMPLSNLMLVFCPSLGMTPPLMKVLCEAREIWGEEGEDLEEEGEEEEEDDDDDVMDIRRRTVVPADAAAVAANANTNTNTNTNADDDIPPPTPQKDPLPNHVRDADAKSTADTESVTSQRSGYHASAEGEDDGPESMSSSLASMPPPPPPPQEQMGQGRPAQLSTTPSVRNRRRRQVVSPVSASARTSEVSTVSTVYLDSRSVVSSMSSLCEDDDDDDDESDGDNEDDDEGEHDPTRGDGAALPDARSLASSSAYSVRNAHSPPLLSASAESIATRTSSSANPSFSQLESGIGAAGIVGKSLDEHGGPKIVEAAPLEGGLISTGNAGGGAGRGCSSPGFVAAAASVNSSTHSLASSAKLSVVSQNNASASGKPIQFPLLEGGPSSSSSSPYHHFPSPPPSPGAGAGAAKSKRRSIPVLSLPSFSPSIAPLFPSMSPAGSPHSAGSASGTFTSGAQQQQEGKGLLKAKKPSLRLLFSKRSASSLTNLKDKEKDRDGKGMLAISSPIIQGQGELGQPPYSAGSAMLAYKHSPRSASDSSVSTPLSAVTAPQSGLQSRSASGSGSGTTLFPPVLDTPIEDGALGLDYGLEGEKEKEGEETAGAEKNVMRTERLPQLVERAEPPVRTTATRRLVVGRGALKTAQNTSAAAAANPTPAHQLYQLRPQASSSKLSVASTASSHHLSLFEEEEEDLEDWTQSVLLAADMDGSWSIQKLGSS